MAAPKSFVAIVTWLTAELRFTAPLVATTLSTLPTIWLAAELRVTLPGPASNSETLLAPAPALIDPLPARLPVSSEIEMSPVAITLEVTLVPMLRLSTSVTFRPPAVIFATRLAT